jgi:ABC-2 type transport system ATP-binding protein
MATPVLSVRQLTKTFPSFTLGPLDMAFVAGRAYGLLGPNGAGKTTFLGLLTLQLRPSSGDIRYRDTAIAWRDTSCLEHIAYIRETPTFYDELTIGQTLQLASRLYRTWDASVARALLARFALDANKPVKSLSKGTAVKLGLVSALAHRTEILILDEPTAGLDPTMRRELQQTLIELKQEQPQLCLILSSHIFEDFQDIADEIVIIKDGRIVLQKETSAIADLATTYHEATV